jgi:hypothetical protein
VISNNYVVRNTGSTYTIDFNNLNIIPSGSYIQIGIPIIVGVTSSLSCSGKIGSSSLSNVACNSVTTT